MTRCRYFACTITPAVSRRGRKVNKKLILELLISVILISTFASGLNVQSIKAEPETIVVPDEYATIQDAINHALNGDTIYVKPGIYYEHVIVNKAVSLIGEDVSTTIIDGNNTGHVIHIASDYVHVTGFTIQKSGNVHSPALDAGICLNHTTDCIISGNRAIDNGFAGISLLYSHQNTIINNNLSSTGWGGIHLLSSTRNIVSGNIIADKYGGVNGHVSSNYNNITENVISNCTYGGFWHAASYNNIRGNNISAIAVEGIWLQDQVSYNVVAENNFISNTVAIRVQGPNYNNILSRNVITGAEYGIKIQDYARYTRITENIIINSHASNDSWSAGIRLDSGGDTEINLNTISDNCYGILLYSSSPRVSIYRNNITENEFGLRVASGGSNYLNVSDNIVMNNRGYGIGLTGFGGASNYATISRNIILNNSDGIALGQYSNYNTILNNNISQNGYGFYVEYSTQNTIWGNNILDNDQQVYVSTGSVNNWDNGYPYGGNYWSDYFGVDVKSGLGQDLPGSDGIGDTPYVIDADKVDHYPLMNLYGAPPPPTHFLTITTTAEGTTDPAPGTYSYTTNSLVQVTAIPNTNYVFDHWELESINVGSVNPYTVPIDKDHTLKAVFSPIPKPPVGGYSFAVDGYAVAKHAVPYLALITILTIGLAAIRRKTTRKTKKLSIFFLLFS